MEKVLCLLYHRINPVEDPIYHLTVSPAHFEEQILFLKEHFPILRFEEDWVKGSGTGVVITFDDGYADNCEYALPILERHQIPATVFVSTGYVDTEREYWWDEIGRLLTLDIAYPQKFVLRDSLYCYEWETDTKEKRIDVAKSLQWILRTDPDTTRADLFIEQLRSWTGVREGARKENLPVSMQQLMRLSSSDCITIGGHTVNHRSLGVRPVEEQRYEIGASVRWLQRKLGWRIEVFSYPFGAAVDYNEDTFTVCEENGIRKAATTVRRLWDNSCGCYEIPRIEVGNYDRNGLERLIRKCGVTRG